MVSKRRSAWTVLRALPPSSVAGTASPLLILLLVFWLEWLAALSVVAAR